MANDDQKYLSCFWDAVPVNSVLHLKICKQPQQAKPPCPDGLPNGQATVRVHVHPPLGDEYDISCTLQALFGGIEIPLDATGPWTIGVFIKYTENSVRDYRVCSWITLHNGQIYLDICTNDCKYEENRIPISIMVV